MSSFSLAPVSSLDRFDDGRARLDLPINYDDYFRLVANPNIFANADAFTNEDGQRHIKLDAVLVKLILEWGYALARKISAASYGGVLPDSQADPLTLRAGSLEALGVPLPPLFQLFRRFQDDGFPLAQSLSQTDFVCWMQVVWENAISTRDWLADAQSQLFIFGTSSGWDFDAAMFRRLSPLSFHAPTITSPSSLRSSLPPASGGCALIPHPIVGPGAANAVIPYPRPRLPSTRPLPENSCRDIIPHPIYGAGAQNTLILYNDTRTLGPDSTTRELLGRSIERPRAPSPPATPFALTDLESKATGSSDTASDSSETPSDYHEPMGYFTVYESPSESRSQTEVSWEDVPIEEVTEPSYAKYQAEAEDALYYRQEEGSSYNPIDLTN
ncbi:hypothetical protein LXA43DRAFT_1102623 [Ganoderma leucocontextum]|nr:hypothetical protein LXA43DRAFT_1102623 [Ganoderma leucocontextum]